MRFPRLFGHVDSDCFYVSCERLRSEALRSLPVGVLGNQGWAVIAKSYELKAAGVKTGMGILDAAKLCPEAIFVKRDFVWYEIISKQLLEAVRLVSPRVQFYSIDELFFDADELPKPTLQSAKELQQKILDEIGIPVSMGIAKTKTLAKLFSDTCKPFGVKVVTDDSETESLLRMLGVGEISGIGKQSEAKLAGHGIKTCWDYAKAERSLIRKLLTVKGESLWWELNGTPTQQVEPLRPPHKAISRGGSLGETTADPMRIFAWSIRNLERLIEELDFYDVLTGSVSLTVEFKEGTAWGGRIPLSIPTASFDTLARAMRCFVREIVKQEKPVTRMHLLAERLTSRSLQQLQLFDVPTPRADKLAAMKSEINKKVGRFALRSGATLPLKTIYDDETTSFDICDVHGKWVF